MGGGTTIGNVRPMAEFNIENDPEAAHVVFEEAWPVVMVGLDLTYQARAYVAVLERARRIDTPAGRFLSDVLQAFAARYKRSVDRGDGSAPRARRVPGRAHPRHDGRRPPAFGAQGRARARRGAS